jgi:hypothetical protein
MRVVLNRIFLGVTLLVSLAAHYEYGMAWREAILLGAAVALPYYIAWEVRTIRVRNDRRAGDV